MQAKSVIVSCLFLDLHISIGGGCLFKSHACFVFLCQLQIRESHVEICILGKGIVVSCHLT